MPTNTTRPSCEVPSAANGAGTNSMTRLNYFNGRFLTAEALRMEQTYWDTRARLVAQVHPTGIAWGLSVSEAERSFTLSPGLAFDGLGVPILVESPVEFTLDDLLAAYELAPLTLQTTRGTNFVDCRCVAPSNGVTGAAAVQPGPYLLMIEPTETACGEAKVYGTTCNTTTNLCETNGWKSGFRISLVALAGAPALAATAPAGEARGVLSAWFFDTLENNLGARWSAPFPDASFCGGPGPAACFAVPVALGLVHIGTGRSLSFFDAWIPRRPIVGTATAYSSTTSLGAPSPAAAVARVHQFQCQLAEGALTGNLYDRGFRHIPPFGFLPIDLSAVGNGEDAYDLWFTNIRQLDEAQKQGKAYFHGTNVYTWCHVALHDDDLFEDMADVFYKDPIFLRPQSCAACPDLSDPCLEPTRIGFLILNWLLAPRGLTIRALVNRETEVVKIIVPLQGLQRADPVDDPCAPATKANPYTSTSTSAARLHGALGTPTSDWMPRQFVVYVKQRLVWIDVVFRIADALSDVAEYLGTLIAPRVGNAGAETAVLQSWQPLVGSFRSPKAASTQAVEDAKDSSTLTQAASSDDAAYVDTGGLRGLLEQRPLRAIGYLRSFWDQLWGMCIVKDLIVRGAVDGIDGFDDPELWATYKARLTAGNSRDEAVDYMVVDAGAGGFAVLKAMVLVLRPSQVEAFENAVYDAATLKEETCPEKEEVKEEDPEPLPPELSCAALSNATYRDEGEKAAFGQLCCPDLGSDGPFGTNVLDEALRQLGTVPATELGLANIDSTTPLAQILLTDVDLEARAELQEEWVKTFAGRWCVCLSMTVASANEAHAMGGEAWSAWLDSMGSGKGCLDGLLPPAHVKSLLDWFAARSPAGSPMVTVPGEAATPSAAPAKAPAASKAPAVKKATAATSVKK